jgi:hypothetical protein
MVTYGYNPSYLGGRNQETHSLRPAQAKEFQRPHLNQYLLDRGTSHSSYTRNIKRRDPISKTTKAKGLEVWLR